MDNFCPTLTRFHHPWKPTGWFSAMDDPMIRIASALLKSCCAVVAPPRPNEVPQTGHGRAMSYTGLVADADHSQANGEQFLDQVVLLNIEGGAAEVCHASGLHQHLAIPFFLKCAFAPVPYPVGNHVHRRF